MERPSHGGLAGDASQRVHSIISTAEQEAATMRRDAERDRDAILRRAEQEAEQLLVKARSEADDILRARLRRLSELSDQVIERTEILLERMEGAEHVKRQLESLIRTLGDAAEAVAQDAGAQPAAPPRREAPAAARGQRPPSRRETIPPPAPERPARRVAQGTARPAGPPSARLKAPEPAGRSGQPPAPPGRSGQPAGHSDPAAGSQLDGARLVALQMAVAGSTRGEVAAELRRGFGVSDPSSILDDVFGESGARRSSAAGLP